MIDPADMNLVQIHDEPGRSWMQSSSLENARFEPSAVEREILLNL